jgi:DNA polymerase
MLIAEAPGAKEDELGRPFCGLSGRFLDKVLADAGIERRELFVTSSVKCRPPRNRTPHQDELATCRRFWLEPQVDLIRPDVVVLMGKVSIGQSLGETGSLSDLHGQVRRLDGRRYLLTYHPAAAMRFPAPRAAMLRDLRKLKRLLETDG